MATTVTAPVAVTHAGEYDPALNPQSVVGTPLPDVVGASTTAAGQIKINVTAPVDGIPDVTVFVTAASSAYTTANKFSYIPTVPGKYKVTVTDVTAVETVTFYVDVFESEGV